MLAHTQSSFLSLHRQLPLVCVSSTNNLQQLEAGPPKGEGLSEAQGHQRGGVTRGAGSPKGEGLPEVQGHQGGGGVNRGAGPPAA